MTPFNITMAACALAALAGPAAYAQKVDWKKVGDAFGRSGAVAGDVHRYGFPRTDLQVTLDGSASSSPRTTGAVTAVIGLIAYPLLQPAWVMVK